MKKQPIILLGGGGHCKSCIDVIEQENKYEILGILDVKEKVGQTVLDYKIIGSDEDIAIYMKECPNFLITLGFIESPKLRIELFNKLKSLQVCLPTIVSPLSYVSKHAIISEGTIIMHDVIINAGAIIKENCIINSKALIEHDAIINKHCHVSTGAIVNGEVEVGESTFFGSGSVSKQCIKIPANSFIKANSIVKG